MDPIMIIDLNKAWRYTFKAVTRRGFFKGWVGRTYVVDAENKREARKVLRKNWVTTVWRLDFVDSERF